MIITFSFCSIYSIHPKTGTHHFWKGDFSCDILLSVIVPVRKRTLSSSVAWTLFDNDKNSTMHQPRNSHHGWTPALCRASCRFAWHLAHPRQAWLRRKKWHLGCSNGIKAQKLRRFIQPPLLLQSQGKGVQADRAPPAVPPAALSTQRTGPVQMGQGTF